jgi:hypothetical protein
MEKADVGRIAHTIIDLVSGLIFDKEVGLVIPKVGDTYINLIARSNGRAARICHKISRKIFDPGFVHRGIGRYGPDAGLKDVCVAQTGPRGYSRRKAIVVIVIVGISWH